MPDRLAVIRGEPILDLARITSAGRSVSAPLLAGCLLLVSLGAVLPTAGAPAGPTMPDRADQPPQGRHQVFEENRGQAGPDTAFVSRADGFVVRLDPEGLELTLPGATAGDRTETMRLSFRGARPLSPPRGTEPLPGTVNYLAGPDPGAWVTAVPTFGAVRYEAIYPGIDLTVRGDYRRLDLDFDLAANADATAIALELDGARRTSVEETSGDLLLASERGVVRLVRPADGTFAAGGGTVTLAAPARPPGQAGRIRIAIEGRPTGEQATGSAREGAEEITRVGVDGAGNTYVAGRTLAAGIGDAEGFVTRFDRGSATPRYTTYFGGGGEDVPLELALGGALADGEAEVIVTGWTRSRDFPVARAAQSHLGGAADAFVLRLAADGSSLVYSTYLGGAGDDEARAVALDASGTTWVAGLTASQAFPGSGAPAAAGSRAAGTTRGATDAFVAAISSEGGDLLRATVLGGSGDDSAEAIGIDESGGVWIAGATRSADFPGGATTGGAFVAAINPDRGVSAAAARLDVGGRGVATSLAFGPEGNLYVAGSAVAPGAPTDLATRGFVAVVVPHGNATPPGTILDLGEEIGGVVRALGADARGDLWVAGGPDATTAAGSTTPPGTSVFRVPADGGEIERTAAAALGAGVRVTGLALDPGGRPVVAGVDHAGDTVAAAASPDAAPSRLRVVQPAASGGLIVAGPILEAAECPGTIQFDGGGGTGVWTTAANWNPDQLPGAADDVCIPAGFTVSLTSASASINTLFLTSGSTLTLGSTGVLSLAAASQIDGGLSLANGTLTGLGDATVNGAISWSAGTMSGAGTTHANGGITFSSSSLKDITTSRVLNTAGTVTLTGTGGIRVGSGASIHNSGLWDAQVNSSINNNLGGVALFENKPGATFRKSAGTGTTTIDLPFDNAGTLEVQIGTLNLSAGGTGLGSFTGSAGTTLQFGGGTYTLDSASALTAAAVTNTSGALVVNGAYTATASTAVSGGAATFNSAATVTSLGNAASLAGGSLTLNSGEAINVTTLSMSSGVLQGGDTVTVSGTMAWSGGAMTGAATTNANGGIAFSGAGVKDLTSSHVLNTAGTSTWTGTGSIRVGSGASIHNTGTWDAQGNAGITALSGAALFTNPAGATFKKSAGGGVTTIGIPFDNDGTLDVQNGSVNVNGGGTGTGSFTGSPGTTLEFGGGTYTLAGASTVTAATVLISGAALDVHGTYALSASTSITSGSVTFNPAATVTSLGTGLSIAVGTVTLQSGESIGLTTLSMTSGVLQGGDTVTVSGTTTWTGGAIRDAATLNAGGGIAIGGASVKDLTGGRILYTAGTTTWNGTGAIRLGGGTVIHNTGTWDAQSDAQLTPLSVGVLFDNATGGAFRKSSGAGATVIDIAFDNAGTVEVQSGTLRLGGGGSESGSFTGSAGTVLQFGGGNYTLDSTSSLDLATLAMSSGTLEVNGTCDVAAATTVTGGTATLNPAATITSLGSALTITSGALVLNSGEPIAVTTLSLAIGELAGSDAVTVSGTTTWISGTMSGAGTTNANGGITFSSGSVKDLIAARVLNTGATSTWSGTGSIRAGGGAAIHNSGIWDAQGDATLVNLGGAAPFDNALGATFKKSAGAGTTGSSIAFDNAGAVSVESGMVSLDAGGTASGSFSGTPGTTLRFSGGTYLLQAASSVTVPSVSITGGAVEVSGAYSASASTSLSGGTATFHPAATVGSAGGALIISGGVLTLNSGEPIDVATLSLATGTLEGADTVTISGTTTWTSGEMTGAATTNANGGIAFSGNAVKDLTAARVLNTAGTTTWAGTGALRIGSGASIHNAGIWDAVGDGVMSNIFGGTAAFENQAGGTFKKSAGSGSTSIAIPFTNAGSVRAQAATLSFTAGYVQTAGSTAAAGGTLASTTALDIQCGSVGGSGTISANIANAGHLAPGLSPGAVTISGALTQTAGAAFDVEIGGLVAGSGHDQANITGVATLAGPLNVTLVNGFVPANADTFTILTFGSVLGAFSSLNLPTLDGDLSWKVHNNPTSIVLEAVADLDGDGVTNAIDCLPLDPTVWSIPAEVPGVVFALDAETVSWASLAVQAGPFTVYDAMRGILSQLPAGGGAAETCLATNSATTQLTDATIPASRTGLYYLVRGKNVCGVGTYGTRSDGTPRAPTACP